MKTLAVGFVLVLLVTTNTAVAQSGSGPGPSPTPAQIQRRVNMEAQVLQAIVQRLSDELRLNSGSRSRLLTFLEEGEAARRALAREGAELDQRLQRALGDSATPDAELDRIIDALVTIRERELMLWRHEQEVLREFLTPRQHVQLLALRSRFNRAVMDVLQQRRPAIRAVR